MHEIFIRYLDKNKSFHLPGIGKFELISQNARLDFINKIIYPPEKSIIFSTEEKSGTEPASSQNVNESHTLIADQQDFPSFLSHYLNMPEDRSLAELEQYSAFVKSHLEKDGFYDLPGLGVLKKNEQDIVLENAFTSNKYFEALPVEQVIRENASHAVRVGEEEKTSEQMKEILQRDVKKEKWWIAAILLAVIGIAAIAFYYFAMNTSA
ncbi:MAG: hypothetical protein JSS67_01085 [Bacteroidetes bacterium]|nr:hypothetical protein [Bacteroidota bacterium]